jgi:uncharacterized membrane protein
VNIPDNLLGEVWCWAAWAVWLSLFALAVWRAPWARLQDNEQINVWLGMIVMLTVIWSMKAGVKPGLSLHLLGATVFTLCFGRHLAFIGLSVVLSGVTLNGSAGFFAFAINALIMACFAVLVSDLITRLVKRYLPKHFFVFIFANGFFGAALTVLSVGLVSTLFMGVSEAYDFDYLTSEYLPYFILLGFSEAWLSGMVLTLFVVYRPNWVSAFDDSLYLAKK